MHVLCARVTQSQHLYFLCTAGSELHARLCESAAALTLHSLSCMGRCSARLHHHTVILKNTQSHTSMHFFFHCLSLLYFALVFTAVLRAEEQ